MSSIFFLFFVTLPRTSQRRLFDVCVYIWKMSIGRFLNPDRCHLDV